MQRHKNVVHLRNRDGQILFTAETNSVKKCLEIACAEGIRLHGLHLENEDLRDLNGDGLYLHQASLIDCNLNDANLSEAHLTACNFSHSTLINTCFAYSNLSASMFLNSQFAATDIAQTHLNHCVFFGPSVFKLDFKNCGNLEGAFYQMNQHLLAMSKPPLVIHGLKNSIIILDNQLLVDERIVGISAQDRLNFYNQLQQFSTIVKRENFI